MRLRRRSLILFCLILLGASPALCLTVLPRNLSELSKKAEVIWSRFKVHHTPKHASWLNQAEIEIGIYTRQCLGKSRIPDIETLKLYHGIKESIKIALKLIGPLPSKRRVRNSNTKPLRIKWLKH